MIALWSGLALAAVVTETPPVQGAETVIAMTDAEGAPASGETVRVVHRPGLAGEKELAVGITDGRGRVRWTPEQAGVARIRAGDELLAVVITPSAVPASTPLLLGLLGLASVLAVGWSAVEWARR
ncbi:MAG: hypothetical protein ABMA64_28300 [Myxococcota bacterium]